MAGEERRYGGEWGYGDEAAYSHSGAREPARRYAHDLEPEPETGLDEGAWDAERGYADGRGEGLAYDGDQREGLGRELEECGFEDGGWEEERDYEDVGREEERSYGDLEHTGGGHERFPAAGACVHPSVSGSFPPPLPH